MDNDRVRAFIFAVLLVVLGGCARSVSLVQPVENNAGQLVSAQDSQGNVNLEIRFHSRADQSTFSAGLDGVDITGVFPNAGDVRTASVPAAPGGHTLRLAARMSPGQAGDSIARNYQLTVTAAPAPPPPPPPPPSPSVNMTVTGTPGSAVWGQTAQFSVALQSQGGFSGPVSLLVDQLPAGITANVPAPVTLNQNVPSATTSLGLATTLAGSPLGSHSFRVRAMYGANTVTKMATLTLRRADGPFVKALHRSANANCNGAVSAAYGAFGLNDIRTTFSVDLQPGGTVTTQAIPAVYYAFSTLPACRVGIVMHPCANASCSGAGEPALSWYNLGWSVGTGAVAIPARIRNLTGINWHQFWFSSDQSLMALVTKKNQAVNCPPTCPYLDLRIFLYDTVTGTALGQRDIRTGATGNIADPVASVSGIALQANTVTISYIRENGNADTANATIP